MTDQLHVQLVQDALDNSHDEYPVTMTFGEMLLFHVLLQDHGIQYTGENAFIPLMERNSKRLGSIK